MRRAVHVLMLCFQTFQLLIIVMVSCWSQAFTNRCVIFYIKLGVVYKARRLEDNRSLNAGDLRELINFG